jgi:polyferredoxin
MRAAGPDSPECIRCGKCIRACDSDCKRWGARRATLTYREG